MFRALVLEQVTDGVMADLQAIQPDRLNEGDVLVSVLFSSLNYKDALAVTGRGKIVRAEYPFVPGIDLVGRVESSESDSFRMGDLVICTGWGLGETRWGGFSEMARVESRHLVALPDGMEAREAMIIGTAGFTAMLSVMALEEHGIESAKGEVLVTGASGGVGSMAVALLHAIKATVTASTGSPAAHAYLRSLGASTIVDRSALDAGPERPMESARWAGAVDVVGGRTLASILSRLHPHASVAACGLAGGHELHTTVFPFILRGVNLLGVDSNTCPKDRRVRAWKRLAHLLSSERLEQMVAATISLEDVPAFSRRLLDGGVQGRILVDLDQSSG